jgi:hypothetical protein
MTKFSKPAIDFRQKNFRNFKGILQDSYKLPMSRASYGPM